MIVKIQQQIGGSPGPKRMFIYNKTRSVEYHDVITPEIQELLGTRPKIYCIAKVTKDSKLNIIEETTEQDW